MAAGLGFKDFATGEVLTANDVDGYLMQGVWVFASAAARTAAVTSPQEGNFSFLKDTYSTEYYTGSAWTPVSAGGGGGKVLQVVSGTTTTQTTNTTSTYADTTLTATITPSANTSKVLVLTTQNFYFNGSSASDQALLLRIMRDATSIGAWNNALQFNFVATGGDMASIPSLSVLDSPATTSATTYKTQFAVNKTGTAYAQLSSVPGFITLLEIGA